jgi:hypothetical protein
MHMTIPRRQFGPRDRRAATVDVRDLAVEPYCVAGLCVVLGIGAAIGSGWLIWQAPHCRPVAARAYYTPLASAQCAAHAHKRSKAQGSVN